MSDSTPSRAARITLAADGCLLTAGTFSLLTSISLLIVNYVGVPIGARPASAFGGFLLAVAWLLGVAGTVLGPWLAWTLHGRAVTVPVLVGALGGFVLSGLVVMAVSFVGAIMGSLLKTVTRSEFAGPIFVLVVVAAALLGVVAWLVYDAIRDLRGQDRAHVRLDIARLAAVVAAAGFAVAAALFMKQSGGAEAGVFAVASAIYGACVVFAADVISGYLDWRAERKAVTTV